MPIPESDLTEEQIKRFTMDGKVDWVAQPKPADGRRDRVWHPAEKISWALEETSHFECGHYGAIDAWLYLAIERYPLRGMTVGLIGSADQGFGPWYEAVILSSGGTPITIDYNSVDYEHPRMTSWTPDETLKQIEAGFRFDALVSISSVEHDGLTRYGDPLNPDGDLEAMQLFRRYLRRDGLFYLSCPVGKDRVCWNAHRIYGKVRLPLLLTDWAVIDQFGFSEKHMERDVKWGWNPKDNDTGEPMFRNYPAYEPIFVLKNFKGS